MMPPTGGSTRISPVGISTSAAGPLGHQSYNWSAAFHRDMCWGQFCLFCTQQTSSNWLKPSTFATSIRRRYSSLRLLCTNSCGATWVTDLWVRGCCCGVDEVKQAAVKSSEDWGPMVCNKPSSSTTKDSNADIWRSSYPGTERPRTRYLYRRWPFHADARSANDFELFRCSPPVTSDPSIGTNGHIPDADGRPCQPTAGLREQHTGRRSSLLNAQAAVRIERCRTADFTSQTLRPHYWRSCQFTLAACAGANLIQNRRADIQSPPRQRTFWGRSPLLLMSLVEELCVLPELSVWSCLQSDWLPSAAELSGRRCPHLELSSWAYRLSFYVAVI